MNSFPSTNPHPALGIDHGEARIGVAATDPSGILAHPVATIDRRKMDAVERIADVVAARGIRTLVVGLPLRMDGSEGTSATKVRAFAGLLRERLPDLPLVFVDESLTTTSAAAKLHQAGRNARQQKSLIDQAAPWKSSTSGWRKAGLWLRPTPISGTCHNSRRPSNHPDGRSRNPR